MTTVAVTSTLTAVLASGKVRGFVRIHNAGPNTVFLSYDGGNTLVTTTIGWPLAIGQEIQIPRRPSTQFPIDAICAATETATLRVQGDF